VRGVEYSPIFDHSADQFFGENVNGAVPPGTIPIADMTPNQIRGAYVLYIGAGAVAAAGLVAFSGRYRRFGMVGREVWLTSVSRSRKQ